MHQTTVARVDRLQLLIHRGIGVLVVVETVLLEVIAIPAASVAWCSVPSSLEGNSINVGLLHHKQLRLNALHQRNHISVQQLHELPKDAYFLLILRNIPRQSTVTVTLLVII